MNRPIYKTLFLLIAGAALLASGGALQAAGSAGMSCPPEAAFSGQRRSPRYGNEALKARQQWMRERIRQQRERMEAMRANRPEPPQWVQARRSGAGYPAWSVEPPLPPVPPQWGAASAVGGAPGEPPAYPVEPGYEPWGVPTYHPPRFAPVYPWPPQPPAQPPMQAEPEIATTTPAPPPAPTTPPPPAQPPMQAEPEIATTTPAPPPAPMTPPPAEGESASVTLPPSDDDADRVVDGRDLCPGTDPSISVDEFGCPQAVPIVLRGVNFHADSDRLTEASSAILDGVAATLVANPEIRLEVSGHTDSDGDDAYNKELSQRRAARVKSYLVEKGVMAGNLVARGYGEEQPITGNETASDKAQNRRVELSRL